MWWPGSSAAKGEEGELDPDDGSPGDGASTPTSDFMEILSEEDILESAGATSSPLEIPASVEDAELRDLKEQFAEQENLLGQLKGVLRSRLRLCVPLSATTHSFVCHSDPSNSDGFQNKILQIVLKYSSFVSVFYYEVRVQHDMQLLN